MMLERTPQSQAVHTLEYEPFSQSIKVGIVDKRFDKLN